MSDHVSVCIDLLTTSQSSQSLRETEILESSREDCCIHTTDPTSAIIDIGVFSKNNMYDEEEPLIQLIECRICQEEDIVKNLENPCACRGSLKFAHRKCVQRWCNEKGDITCEICNQPYQPGYTAPTLVDIRTRNSVDMHEPRLISTVAAERHFLEAEYDDTNASRTAFCRSTALLFLALLLLRHVMIINNDDTDDEPSTFISLFLLRAAGFLVPCYIMVWVFSVLQRRRERQVVAEALSAPEVAFLVQTEQNNEELQIPIPPRPALIPHHEPLLQ